MTVLQPKSLEKKEHLHKSSGPYSNFWSLPHLVQVPSITAGGFRLDDLDASLVRAWYSFWNQNPSNGQYMDPVGYELSPQFLVGHGVLGKSSRKFVGLKLSPM